MSKRARLYLNLGNGLPSQISFTEDGEPRYGSIGLLTLQKLGQTGVEPIILAEAEQDARRLSFVAAFMEASFLVRADDWQSDRTTWRADAILAQEAESPRPMIVVDHILSPLDQKVISATHSAPVKFFMPNPDFGLIPSEIQDIHAFATNAILRS